jgi:hypothetical protein
MYSPNLCKVTDLYSCFCRSESSHVFEERQNQQIIQKSNFQKNVFITGKQCLSNMIFKNLTHLDSTLFWRKFDIFIKYL